MRMRSRLGIVAAAMIAFPAAAAAAQTVEPATAQTVEVVALIQRSAEFDGQAIALEGELIGDYGFRGDGWMWTQLNGDVYVEDPLREGGKPAGGNIGVGLRIPEDLAVELDHPGGYHHRGPVVRVSGRWEHHDPLRQGESYLQVESLMVIESGRPMDEGVVWWTVLAGVVLLAAAGGIWLRLPR